MFNCSIDSAGVWNLNTDTYLGYNNYVSYLSLDKQSDSQKNTTRSTTWRERLSFSYRNNWLELSLDGTLNYNHATNKLQPNSNLNTWQFSYGPSMTLTAPWGTSLNSSLSISSRRGYSDSSMNTDEFVWNAQLSQGFLKGKLLPSCCSSTIFSASRAPSLVPFLLHPVRIRSIMPSTAMRCCT